jgi:ribosomal protein L29
MSKVKEIKEDLDRLKSINVLSQSEGGLLMIKSTRKEVLNSLDKLAYNYPTLSHTELLAECANLRARLEMLRLFNASKKNQPIAEEDLKVALEEELES